MLIYRATIGMALIVAVLSGALAQSSRQNPQPQIKGGNLGRDNSPAKPSPTISFPTLKEIEDAIANGIERANEKNDANHPSLPPDNSGWWFNFFLVGFTGLLVVVGAAQCILIFGTLKATETAANAAKASADALPAIERAYVFLKCNGEILHQSINSLISIRNSETTTSNVPTVLCWFENHGRTPAVVKKLSIGLRHMRVFPETMPDSPLPFANWEKVIRAGGLIPTEKPGHFPAIDPVPLRGVDLDTWEREEWFFYFFGAVIYEDVMGQEHVTSFLWRFGKRESFDEWGGKKYNYRN